MQWSVEFADKGFAKNPPPFLILPAEKESLLGDIPDAKALGPKVKEAATKQTQKTLTGTWELLVHGDSQVAIGQIPSRKGLDRADQLRLFAGSAWEFAKSRSAQNLTLALEKASADDFKAIAEGLLLVTYEFKQYKSEAEDKTKAQPSVTFRLGKIRPSDAEAVLGRVASIHARISQARDFVNEPGSVLTPSVFVDLLKKQSKEAGISLQVLDEKALQKQGFTGLWTVGKGSNHPPRLVHATYDGSKKKKGSPHLALVGKGITFDTGGISLKPSQGMWEMKCDMAGAATAWGAFLGIVDLKLPVKVSVVLCLAENRPGNASVLPGDIFKAKNGKTVMVDNTDAEGRLVLTDGLWQAGALGATHIVDMATLTGAIVRAIGPSIAGVFTNDEAFGESLTGAGRKESEKFCVLPLEAEYREWLDDPVADMRNVGKAEAGAITAALFLQEFIPDKTVWAHLDIAGTAFTTSTWKYYRPGATGFGIKSLIRLASQLAGGV